MRGKLARVVSICLLLAILIPGGGFVLAQTNIKATPINYTSRLFFSPRTITVTANSEFDASLFLDTTGFTINTLDIRIDFSSNLLSVVKPSSGESIIDLWVAPPKYSNSRGTVEFSGIIPGGAKTQSGLVEKITFRALAPGVATVLINKASRILMNDGFGTEAALESIPVRIVIEPRAPDGLIVMSHTHPFQGEWSNNKNPSFYWERQRDGETYSFLLDDKPLTVPDDVIEGPETEASFESIKDGVWYFHLKAKSGKVWSNTTHYAIRVDTTPPAQFTPSIDFLSEVAKAPGIVSFFTTDALSGVARYEIGVLDVASEPETLPAFIQSESPYFLPREISRNILLTVRATDNAGNSRDTTLNVKIPPFFLLFAKRYSNELLISGAVLALLCGLGMVLYSRRRRPHDIHPDDLRNLIDYVAQERRRLEAPARPQYKESEYRLANKPVKSPYRVDIQ